ncbi:hypothetical protein QQ045_000568 [Rhodiola kirilowii]
MVTERVVEFPIVNMDKRPRKRQRLGWDVPQLEISLTVLAEILNVTDKIYFYVGYAHVFLWPGGWEHDKWPGGWEHDKCDTPLCLWTSQTESTFSHGLPNVMPRSDSPSWRKDDKDGHYTFAIGDNLTPRYKIQSKMGEGTFGQVLECWDRESNEMVAIKIVRGVKEYREAAMIEIKMLEKLGKHDIGGNRCVQIRNWFDYRIIFVFEKLGLSLYDFLRKNSHRSFPIDLVREIGRQLLECIAFMHDMRLIHTDLKSENVL